MSLRNIRAWIFAITSIPLVAQAPTESDRARIMQRITDECGDGSAENGFYWQSFRVQIVRVIDGCTVVLKFRDRNKILRVYLCGVNAPREGQSGWRQSKQSLLSLVKGMELVITVTPSKFLGHSNVAVLWAGKTDVGARQISLGMAKFETPTPYSMPSVMECSYKILQNEAFKLRLGIWHQ